MKLLCDGKYPNGATCDRRGCAKCMRPIAKDRDLCRECAAAGRSV